MVNTFVRVKSKKEYEALENIKKKIKVGIIIAYNDLLV